MPKATKTHCRKGHPYKRDSKGRLRCLICERERYRAKHPFQHRAKMAGFMAPRMRGQSERAVNRKVAITHDGEVIGYTTLGKVQESLVKHAGMEFEVGEGVRPSKTVCQNCGRPFETNTQGHLARVCLNGCDHWCSKCGKPVTVKSARAFAMQGRKPVCRKCADLGRPKITHCKRGHELTPENTLLSPKTGQRFCRTCKRERMRKSRAKRK